MDQGQSPTNETKKMHDDEEDSDGPLRMNDLSACLDEDVDISEIAGAQNKKRRRARKPKLSPNSRLQAIRETNANLKDSNKDNNKIRKKRAREELSSPEGSKVDGKKSKNDARNITYAKVVQTIKMFVIPIDYPEGRLTTAVCDEIENFLLERIDEILDGEQAPSFQNRKRLNGYMNLACIGEFTKSWLVESLKDKSFDGKAVKVVASNELPRPPTCKLRLPGPETSHEKILRRFGLQNKDDEKQRYK